MPTIKQWLQTASDKPGAHRIDPLDAQLLLSYALGKSRTHLIAWPDATLDDDQLQKANALLSRRAQGEPLAYITGEREFWSLPFRVNEAVLIPRPETEMLVEQTLLHHREKPARCIVDAGTGSGAIAVALAHSIKSDHLQASNIIATDISAQSLTVARDNIEMLCPGEVSLVQSHWLAALAAHCADIIVSNPPYIEDGDSFVEPHVREHEPGTALYSGPDGLNAIRTVLTDSRRVGVSGCKVILEHGFEQSQAVQQLMHSNEYRDIQTLDDLAGHGRVTIGCCP